METALVKGLLVLLLLTHCPKITDLEMIEQCLFQVRAS